MPDNASRLADDSGQGAVEYALILAVASVGIIAALMILRNSVGSAFHRTSARIDAASTPGGGGSGSTVETGTGASGGGNGQGNSGNGTGNGGPNGGNNGHSGDGNNGNGNGNGGSK
jgi:Flp pilus assembly pilin Flp